MTAFNNYWDTSFKASSTNRRRMNSEIRASASGGDGGGGGNDDHRKWVDDDGSEGGDGPAFMAAAPLLANRFGDNKDNRVKDLNADLSQSKE